MVLKLLLYIRSVISFFNKPKPGEILIFGTFLAKFKILPYIVLKIGYFKAWPCLRRHCDIIRRMFVLILICMERREEDTPQTGLQKQAWQDEG